MYSRLLLVLQAPNFLAVLFLGILIGAGNLFLSLILRELNYSDHSVLGLFACLNGVAFIVCSRLRHSETGGPPRPILFLLGFALAGFSLVSLWAPWWSAFAIVGSLAIALGVGDFLTARMYGSLMQISTRNDLNFHSVVAFSSLAFLFAGVLMNFLLGRVLDSSFALGLAVFAVLVVLVGLALSVTGSSPLARRKGNDVAITVPPVIYRMLSLSFAYNCVSFVGRFYVVPGLAFEAATILGYGRQAFSIAALAIGSLTLITFILQQAISRRVLSSPAMMSTNFFAGLALYFVVFLCWRMFAETSDVSFVFWAASAYLVTEVTSKFWSMGYFGLFREIGERLPDSGAHQQAFMTLQQKTKLFSVSAGFFLCFMAAYWMPVSIALLLMAAASLVVGLAVHSAGFELSEEAVSMDFEAKDA